MNFNKVILVGYLTRKPELKYLQNGTATTTFGIATTHKYKSNNEWKEDVCFIDITVWSRLAENCTEYLDKGRPVIVEGRLCYQTWITKNGEKRSKHTVIANNIQFLGRDQIVRKEIEQDKKIGKPIEDDLPF